MTTTPALRHRHPVTGAAAPTAPSSPALVTTAVV
jgi:hypothetical protein